MSAAAQSGAPPLPGSLNANRRLSQWLRFRPEGAVEVFSGKVEIGQGILTALAQIVAEDLDIALSRVRVVPASTAHSANEGVTSGSLSIQDSGTALRYVCAEARAIYLDAAARKLGVAADTLRIEDGTMIGAGNVRTSYWELADDTLLAREATGRVLPKAAALRAIAGTSAARIDIPAKVFGRIRFVHDLVLSDMLHGRVLRPRSPGAKLVTLDEARARALPGIVDVVRDGDFAGVIAEEERTALAALAHLREGAVWQETATLPDETRLSDWLKSQPADTYLIDARETASTGQQSRTIRRTYTRPFLAHAPSGPSCAIAQWTASGVKVWTHSQGIYNLRADLALALSVNPESIVVHHVEGAGCYGHNGADDVAYDAVLLARAAGERSVRVVWTHEDDLTWAPFGPAAAIDLEADLDDSGEVLAWRYDVWSNGHVLRPGRAKTPVLLAGWHLAQPFPRAVAGNPPLATGGGVERNAIPPYDFPSWRLTSHRLLAMPLRTSALRSLGAYANVFAVESFVDEIAAGRGEDPIAYRLRHLKDARARAAIEAAAAGAGWSTWRKREGAGHGIGFARYKTTGAYCAVVAEIEAERAIRVRRLVVAVDVGEVVNPDGVVNQIEGGAVQATSWTLHEAVRFDRTRVTGTTWENYPILRFSEVPAVEVVILDRPGEKSVGAGEAALGPTAAAIANAVSDALGVRVCDLPLTPDRILAVQ
ncbi:MAG: molybdopterin cofactor-binding domain-containing protein [Hyphomicrobiaceae bacterium]